MKQTTPTSKAALLRAIDVLGSQKALAAVVSKAQGHVSHWLTSGRVPAEYCPPIEAATRKKAAHEEKPELVVTCEELRPDVAWSVLRDAPAVATNSPAEA